MVDQREKIGARNVRKIQTNTGKIEPIHNNPNGATQLLERSLINYYSIVRGRSFHEP